MRKTWANASNCPKQNVQDRGGGADGRREKGIATEWFPVAKEMGGAGAPSREWLWAPASKEESEKVTAQQLKGDTNNFTVNCVQK